MTIKEAIEDLQRSIQAAMPGMEVSVNINIKPAATPAATPAAATPEETQAIELPDEMPEDLAKEIDLAALKKTLNAYARQVGKTQALKLVKNFAGSHNPADIPQKDYNDVLSLMGKDINVLEISFDKSEGEDAA